MSSASKVPSLGYRVTSARLPPTKKSVKSQGLPAGGSGSAAERQMDDELIDVTYMDGSTPGASDADEGDDDEDLFGQ